MKILFVADVSIENVIGGAERVLREQAVRLAGKGHEVHVLTRQPKNHAGAHARIEGVHEWRYDVNRANSPAYFLSSLGNCRKLYKKIIRDIRFDLINYHQPFSAFAVGSLKQSRHIPQLYTCHSLSFEEFLTRRAKENPSPGMLLPFHVGIRKYIEKSSFNFSSGIIVLSRFTQDKLVDTYRIAREKIIVIPGAVDLNRFQPADRAGIRARMNIPLNRFVLFTVRNLVPRMGLDNLLKAMALLRGRIPDCCLFIGGTGMLKERLSALIKELNLQDNVALTGFLPEQELLRHYQMSDFFILPTAMLEGFGLVTVESLSCGTPVLGTPVGGTREILGRFDESFLFKDTSPEAMAELILMKYQAYHHDPAVYHQLREKCRLFAEENYSWKKNISLTEEAFLTCAAPSGKSL